jgi:ribosomal protein L11 methyltransferase PrmA/PRMT5 arginine-N-methyltransferase
MSLVIDEHRQYIADRARVTLYARALEDVIRPGDVVVDLASGTGILGMLACRYGARRVFAIEATPMAGLARQIARSNDLHERIEVLRVHSTEAHLPEPADVVVSDQIGRFGVDAGLLALTRDARARLLKPGGRLVPSALTLVLAPVEAERLFNRVRFWQRRPAGLDFGAAFALAANTVYPARFCPEALLADPVTASELDLEVESPQPLRLEATFTAVRSGVVHGLGGWFSARLAPSVQMSNSPLDPERIRRRQAFFPIEHETAVERGDRIAVTMRILPAEHVFSWTVTITRASHPPVRYAQSTLKGMLIDNEDLRLTDPDCRPTLIDRGLARRTVLELCDGTRTLAQIEADVLERHRALFASAEEAAVFVGEVVTRYARCE